MSTHFVDIIISIMMCSCTYLYYDVLTLLKTEACFQKLKLISTFEACFVVMGPKEPTFF